MLRPLSPAAVKAMLTDDEELALIDVREELVYSQNHLLWARSVPLSRIELRFARLVPRKATRIVLIDDGDGLVARAEAILTGAGYSDVACLAGGGAGWEKAGLITFSGMHVPSKAFGEFVEHDSGTPSVSAQELDAMMRSGTDMKVLDSRPFDEFNRVSIPTGIDVPGAELVLRVRDIVPSPETTIVVNCAGRTRSIIGAQSLIDAGVANKVVALRNGTMGWHLAGLKTASGETKRFPDVTDKGLAWARDAAEKVAHKFGVQRIDRAALARLQADTGRTTYVFDVRDPDEYRRGHLSGAVSAPGGQLVQATDTYAGTLGARIVLSDDKGARALMSGAWLRRMGWPEVYVLAEAGDETGDLAPAPLGAPPMDAAIDAAAIPADATIIDLARSPDYRRGHVPGAWFAIRGRLGKALATIASTGPIVLTSEDGLLAGLAVAEAREHTTVPVTWLRGGTAAWTAAGKALSKDARMADEAIDVWLKPYEKPGDPKAGMQEYLTWEVDLIDRIKADGTCDFLDSEGRRAAHG
ncbi:MAG: rhodanese-like domain-containing protein [Pseudolabrys sp.]